MQSFALPHLSCPSLSSPLRSPQPHSPAPRSSTSSQGTSLPCSPMPWFLTWRSPSRCASTCRAQPQLGCWWFRSATCTCGPQSDSTSLTCARSFGSALWWRCVCSQQYRLCSFSAGVSQAGTSMQPNPSIERTANGRLRLPPSAAHVERWASQHMARIPLLALMFVATVAVAGAAVPAACLEFDKYPITEIFRGPYVKPNLSTPAQVHRFRTVIQEGSEGAPDFAGRFRVVHWGCGSNCHAFALVDRKTGEVYPVPETAALGAGFRLNSGLFVIDTPEMIKESGSPLFATMTFAWNEQSRSLVAL